MRIDRLSADVAEVVLSERNLLSLLSKVRRDDSERTLMRVDGDGRYLVVKVETDDKHYAERIPAGPVHPLDDPGVAA